MGDQKRKGIPEELRHKLELPLGAGVTSPVETWVSRDAPPMGASRLDTRLLGRSLEVALSSLPEVEAPSLEGLSVRVPSPPSIDEMAVLTRLDSLCFLYGKHIPREEGEPIRLDDRVVLDVIGYSNQRVIPFSVCQGVHTWARRREDLPGFAEALVGLPVGAASVVQLALPESFPILHLHQQLAAFAVVIHGAWSVTPLSLDSPNDLRRLGMGSTLDEVFQQLLLHMEEEMAEGLVQDASRRVLEELAGRVSVKLPERLVDEEIRLHWLKREGLFLQQNEVAPEDMEAALSCWLLHDGIRREARWRLKMAVALQAIARDLAPPIASSEFPMFVDAMSEAMGFSAAHAQESLRSDSHIVQQLLDKFVFLRTLDFVLTQASVAFEGVGPEH